MPAVKNARIDPSLFHGYPVNLIQGLVGLGPSIIGDDKLYAAVAAYAKTSAPGSSTHLGPAILSDDPHTEIQSISVHRAPKTAPAPVASSAVVPRTDEEAWDALELDDLIALAAKHDVVIPGRVKTHGKVRDLLITAGVAPPKAG